MRNKSFEFNVQMGSEPVGGSESLQKRHEGRIAQLVAFHICSEIGLLAQQHVFVPKLPYLRGPVVR